MSTTYTPTKRNLAHAATKDFSAALAGAVRDGIDAGSLTTAELAEAAGVLPGEVTRIETATALSLDDAMHIALAMDGAGKTAFKTSVGSALDTVLA